MGPWSGKTVTDLNASNALIKNDISYLGIKGSPRPRRVTAPKKEMWVQNMLVVGGALIGELQTRLNAHNPVMDRLQKIADKERAMPERLVSAGFIDLSGHLDPQTRL